MNKTIICCNCQAESTNHEKFAEIEAFFQENKLEYHKLTDLCGFSATEKGKVNELFSVSKPFILLGCRSRSMKKLLQFAGVDVAHSDIEYLDWKSLEISEILEKLSGLDLTSIQETKVKEIKHISDWPSWYPVLDYDRCTACGQCADFCLFGVYEKMDSKVSVVNPKACKNNCPACARICPQTAIIFPKYKNGGAISGSDSIEEIEEQKRMQNDVNEILGSDVYAALEQRSRKRKSIIKTEELLKAEQERKNALEN